MKTDRELLELAAKAAFPGLWEWNGVNQRIEILQPSGYYKKWHPLEDDGDALRLAVATQLTVCNEHVNCGAAYCTREENENFPTVWSGTDCDGPVADHVIADDYIATRRAIVLAAAEIQLAKERA